MKFAFLILFLCFESCAFGTHSKPCLRALIVGDTVSKNIRPGSEIDIFRMKKSLSAIAHQIHYQPKIVTLYGKKLSPKRLQRWILSIKKNSRDIVFFYFTGHGGRTFNQTQPLPIIALPTIKPKNTIFTVKADHIYTLVAEKHPRLGICIFDCCNNTVTAKYLFDKKALSAFIVPKNHPLPGLKSLFVKTRGLICIAAASPGQPAVTAVSGIYPGSFLTTGLLHSLIHESQTTKATWKKVCKASSFYIKNILHGKQRPMYFLSVPKDTSTTNPYQS